MMTPNNNVIFAYASAWPPEQSNTTGRSVDEKYNVYVNSNDDALDEDCPVVIMPRRNYDELSVKPNTEEIDNASQEERDKITHQIGYLEALKDLLEYTEKLPLEKTDARLAFLDYLKTIIHIDKIK